MKYGDYILRLWDGMGEPHTMWYISLEDARRAVCSRGAPAALLVHETNGKQSVVFAYSRNF